MIRASMFLVLLAATNALAQAPSPSPSPSPAASPAAKASDAPGAPKAGAPGPDAPKEGEAAAPGTGNILLNANTLERDLGHSKARGFVDLQAGDIRIQADQLDLYETPRPDGGVTRRLVAEGNVVFMRGEERLAGERLEMDLGTNRGTFLQAFGFVPPGVLIEGDKIERLDASTYKIEDGRFTSCTQPTPRWSFTTTSATMKIDDKIKAWNVVFKVRGVPALYIPYLIYPIEQDQRSTGFLMPHIGQSTQRGFNIGGGFFWAMGRSVDQTFSLDHFSQYGWGFGHELRFLRTPPDRGTFRSFGVRLTEGGWEHDLDWSALQSLPGKVRATLAVHEASRISFRPEFNEDLDRATNRTRQSSVGLQRSFGSTTVQLLADSTDTFFGSDDSFTRQRHLPTFQVTRSPQRIRRTGLVLGFEGRAENLAIGSQVADVPIEDQEGIATYGRYDVYPRLSRPFSLSFLQLTPEVQYRWTGYGVSDVDLEGGRDLSGPARSRTYFQTSLEMRGPTFSRVFDSPGNFYSERYKHTIGPEVTWTRRSKVDDFEAIPYFDGNDRVLGTNEVNYALVQRFYSKRTTTPGGKTAPYQFLNWRVSQTYYVDIAEGQNEFDPNYSTAIFGPDGTPSHNSPLLSRMRFTPLPTVGSTFDLEYDVNFKSLRRLSLAANVDYARAGFEGLWSRRRIPRANAEVFETHTVRGTGRFQLIPGKLNLRASTDYDLFTKSLVQASGRLRYDVQCCGFLVEAAKSTYTGRDDIVWRFSVELANVGSIGNFGGQDGGESGRGLPR